MNRQPRVAFVDIETAPSLGFYFDKWKEGNIIATQAEWYMLSFAYKWQGERRVTTRALPDYPGFNKRKDDDRDLVKDLHRVFDEADVIIAHNGDRFDIRKSNARFIEHGLEPPAPYKTVDTLKLAKRHFKFDSNRLDALGQSLGVGRKLPHTGVHLWLGCMHGDQKSWRIMRRYNARDVELLERVYERLKPWATNHPNLNLYSGRSACPTCQSTRIKARGLNYGKSVARQRWQCLDCHSSWSGQIVKPGDQSCDQSAASKSAKTARATGTARRTIRARATSTKNRSRRAYASKNSRKR